MDRFLADPDPALIYREYILRSSSQVRSRLLFNKAGSKNTLI